MIEKSVKLIDIPSTLIKNHSHQICIPVQFYSMLRVKSSGAEYFYNVEFWCAEKNLETHLLVL